MKKVAFAQQSWATGAGHAAKTATLPNVSGLCTRIDIIASAVTDDPDVTVTITDTDNSGQYFTSGAKDDGTHHILYAHTKGATDSDFAAIPLFFNNLTVSIDPSADPGGSDQTLTVDVILYLEDP